MAQKRLRAVSSWIEEAKHERENEEDLLACRLIVLKIVRYMKDHHLSQKELAEKFNVSPQYISKFLHGQDLDMKVSTALRYGRILGIKLIDVPGQNEGEEIMCSFVSAQFKMGAVQPECFDYIGNPFVVPRFKSIVRNGVVRSSKSYS